MHVSKVSCPEGTCYCVRNSMKCLLLGTFQASLNVTAKLVMCVCSQDSPEKRLQEAMNNHWAHLVVVPVKLLGKTLHSSQVRP